MENSKINLFGEVLRKREVTDLVLTETAYAPHLKLDKHAHRQSYFCFVLQGNYLEVCARKERFCQPATLIFHAANELHANRFDKSGGRCFNIQLDSGWNERIELNDSAEIENLSVKTLAQRLYHEFASFDSFSHLAIEGLFLEMSAQILRGKEIRRETAPMWLKRAREILHEQFSENLTVEDLAREVSVHPVHLARTFRQKFHCTIGEYARFRRIEYARRELSSSTKTLAEIAYLAGFSSQSHFTTVFKRLTGATPSEYRKKC